MKRTTVLFDMDGLMVDTEPLARAAWQRVVAPYGLTVADDVYERMLGRRTVESAQLMLDALPLPLSRDELVARKTAEYLRSLDGGVPVMPGLWVLLARIDALAIPWGVATSTPRRVAEIVLGKLGVVGRYAALAAGDEVAHGKPAPDIFLLAAARLGAPAAACLALEDSAAGCAAAAAAGMRVVAVPTEQADPDAFAGAYRRYASLSAVAADLELLLL
ncbi:HAD-superfamily hydrolase, subfamily IA, variant 3 [Candidatus Promineifilum breve]|uniref:HAD-superfamily hydrolase, subfamily IA, variant 3 n=1 Tax=Candidatus Promineifilum breve TaxID=1806508 RepID=A0A160T2P5_9CHLR|nr:HAD family phosphatase [Candidatus Promineifilum breve]CUS03974.2 HAD-superfamily hydrolase, subfamily IA, variant 3 [Candidatus Promineifilum breve]